MGFALATDVCDSPPSAEAEQRIASAQEYDIAFVLRRIASKLPNDDVFFLASILNEALRTSPHPSKDDIMKMLLARGRSSTKAKELLSAIFK